MNGSKDQSDVEMRNMLMETEGKVILFIKWQRTLLNCVCVLVFCGK